jgi:hypothetical protein
MEPLWKFENITTPHFRGILLAFTTTASNMSHPFNRENRRRQTQFNQLQDFILNESKGKHILLLYEEPERAREIEFQFLKQGLEHGEHCTFLVHFIEQNVNSHVDLGDHHKSHSLECIEREMKDGGINVDAYEEKAQLRIFPVPNLIKKAGGFDNISGIWDAIEGLDEDLFSQMVAPFRGVGIRLPVNKLHGEDRMNALAIQIDIEKKGQIEFERGHFRGSWICPYMVDNLADSLEHEQSGLQILSLIAHHEAVIYAPALKEPVVLRLSF